jgi:hypothetical protein
MGALVFESLAVGSAPTPDSQLVAWLIAVNGVAAHCETAYTSKAMSSSVYVYGCLTSNSYSTTAFVFLPPLASGT